MLNGNIIHIWHTMLEYHTKKYKLFQSWLSDEEKSRAEKLAMPYRQRFIISRGLLRDLLAYYSKQCPKKLSLAHTSLGKPFLVCPPTKQQIQFNLSHSQNIIAYAFNLNTPVGIDIEHKIQRKHLAKIAYRFFSACDYDHLKQLTGEEQLNAFFNAWVRNEASLKAFGFKLQTHPRSLYKSQLMTKYNIRREIPSPCYITTLSLYPDFVGALAIKGIAKSIIINKYIERMS